MSAHATITSLVYKPQHCDFQPPTHFVRLPLEQARLVPGQGIEGDKKAVPGRELNIMSHETMQALASEGFRTGPGQLGEQIIISGLDVDGLMPDTIVQIGDRARVRIIKPRTGCKRFVAIQGKSQTQATGRLGVIAVVEIAGLVCIGDEVRVVEPAHA